MITEAIHALAAQQIKDEDDVSGALERVYSARYDSCLLLIFEDGRWAHYIAVRGYDAGDTTVEFESGMPDIKDLLNAGLLTAEQYAKAMSIKRKESDDKWRENELAELARLKAKYEGQL